MDAIEREIIETLEGLAHGCEAGFVDELIELFLSEAPMQIEGVRAALARGDAAALREWSHSLKGSSAGLGAVQFSQLCGCIEQQAREGRLAEAQGAVARLEAEFPRLEGALRRAGSSLTEAAAR
jgi:HPt (histidine-containing phosphotransfer) domain-containing protein